MRKLLWIFLLPLQVFATNYYVSNSGSDAAAGTIGAPWASISRVNTAMASLVAGDSVLFQRGGEFFGTLTVNKAGVIIGAYGSGNLPIITGFRTITGWTNVGTNLWQAAVPTPKSSLKVVTINNRLARVGRFPDYSNSDAAWIRYTNSFGATSPVNINSGSNLPTSFIGGECVIQKYDYIMDVMPITGQSGNTLTCTNPGGLYGVLGAVGGNSFFIQNHPATLTTQDEWYFNGSNKTITIYSTSIPTATIKAAVFDTLINIGSTSNVTIENLDIQGSNYVGFLSFGDGINWSTPGTNPGAALPAGNNLIFKNNIVRFIGYWGVVIRGTNSIVSGNTVRDIGSNGIWVNNSATISDNVIKSINAIEGMGGNNGDQGIGITIKSSAGVICRRNIIDTTGYSCIRFDANNVTILENFVQNSGYTKADCGAIYTWHNNGNDIRSNILIKKNIIANCGKIIYGLVKGGRSNFFGMYMDGGANNITLDSNIIAYSNVTQNSIFNSDENFDDHAILFNNPVNITLTNTITFGWPGALWINDYTPSITSTKSKPVGNNIQNNAFYVNALNGSNWKETNRSFFYLTQGNSTIAQIQTDIRAMGTMNNNIISNHAQSPYHWTCYSVDGAFPAKLADWQTFSGKDINSTSFPITAPEFQYNATATPTTYTFTGRQKRDFRGNTYNNSATIPAYYGNIFFDNGPAGANPPTASCSATTISCNGGSATVTVTGSGGTPPLSGTGTFTRTAGTYTFTVTDANGLTGTCSVTITQPTALVASNTAGTITTVGGSANIIVTASGGTAPYTGTGTFSRTAGTYTFTVTDANGCTATTTRTLTNPSPVVVTCSASPILCNGGTSTVTVSASGGTGPYLNTGSFIRSAGSYTFSVTDAVGATGSCSVTITEPAVLVAAATAGTISSVGGTTSVVVTATGGVGPYTGTGTFTRGSGIHTFTVTDANGCTSFVIVSLNDPVIVAPQTLRINNIRFTNGN